MTSFAAPRARRTATSAPLARSAQRLTRPFAAAGSSVARSFRSFDAAADLRRAADDRTLVMLMFGRD